MALNHRGTSPEGRGSSRGDRQSKIERKYRIGLKNLPERDSSVEGEQSQRQQIVERYRASLIAAVNEGLEREPLTEILLPISVGQIYHENGRWKATLKWLRANFPEAKFVVLVGDTIQRYSDAITAKYAEFSAYELTSRKNGDGWIGRAKEYLDSIIGESNYTLKRWDEVRRLSSFDTSLRLFQDLYHSSDTSHVEFRTAVDESVQLYLQRRKERKPGSSSDSGGSSSDLPDESCDKLCCSLSVLYILEELAGFNSLFMFYTQEGKKAPAYLVYPGGILPALDVARKKYFEIAEGTSLPFEPLNLNITEKKSQVIEPSIDFAGPPSHQTSIPPISIKGLHAHGLFQQEQVFSDNEEVVSADVSAVVFAQFLRQQQLDNARIFAGFLGVIFPTSKTSEDTDKPWYEAPTFARTPEYQ